MEDKNIEYLKKLIQEVKQELASKKMIVENKTPEQVFNKHTNNIKDYVSDKVFEAIKQSEK